MLKNRCPSWDSEFPVFNFKSSVEIIDNSLKESLEAILNIKLNNHQWSQASLPINAGGLGIRKLSDIALPAYISSLFGTESLISQILDNKGNEGFLSNRSDFVKVWSAINESIPVSLPSSQNSWDKINTARIRMALSAEVTEDVDKARLLALECPESNSWLDVLPCKSLGTVVDDNSFRIIVALRLGCRICMPHRCSCGELVDSQGLHGLSCIKSVGRLYRHRELNLLIQRALSSINTPACLEPIGLARADGKRVDGMTMIPWSKGEHLIWDATCTDTLAPSYVKTSSLHVRKIANIAANKKTLKYKDIIERGYIFVPFAVETLGPLCDEALSFIKVLGKKLIDATGEKKARYFLLQKIGLAIQRGNACSIMGTLDMGPGMDELFYLDGNDRCDLERMGWKMTNGCDIKNDGAANKSFFTINNNNASQTKSSLLSKSENELDPLSVVNSVSKGTICQIKSQRKSEFVDPTYYKMGEFLLSYVVDGGTNSLQPRGLINKSNYCYINSILQAMLACSPLFNLLCGLAKYLPLSKISLKTNTPIIDNLCRFVHEFQHLTAGKGVLRRSDRIKKKDLVNINYDAPFEPAYIYIKILNCLKSDSFLMEGRQEDAEEFFGCLLNGLSDEMQELMKLVDSDDVKENELAKVDIKDETDELHVMGPKNKGNITRKASFRKTPIINIFGGLLKSNTHRCGDEPTYNIQPFFTLQLNIEKAKTVEEALEALVAKNQLEDVTSSNTNVDVEAWHQVTIEELPIILVLHLKYFDFNLKGCTKIIKALEFPIVLKIDSKILSNESSSPVEKQYKLFAVVYHEGKEASIGHYLTDAFHFGYNNWIRYNDSIVKAVPEEHVLTPQVSSSRVPYLLFYQRIDTIRNKLPPPGSGRGEL